MTENSQAPLLKTDVLKRSQNGVPQIACFVFEMLDSVGTTSYGFTVFGALQNEDGPWADDAVSYSYTANRLRSGVSLSQPNGPAWTQTYAYDAANRLTTVTSPAGT